MFAHARAPVRIGIAGGGTDLPAWTKERSGFCLSLAINRYTHAAAIDRPDRQVVASYRHLDVASSATEIANGLIRESALMHGFEDGFEVHTLSQVPSQGSGLGVSSSIAVCLAAVFERMRRIVGRSTDLRAQALDPKFFDGGEDGFRAAVARDAAVVEIERLRRPIGRQDHMAAAWGGLRQYTFTGDCASVRRTFSREEAKWVAEHLLLIRLEEGHDSRAILSGARRVEQLEQAAAAVPLAEEAIRIKNVCLLGEAMTLGYRSKHAIPGAVTPSVKAVVDQVVGLGVCGVKVCGAGGGGHLVAVVEDREWSRDKLAAALGLEVFAVEPDFDGVRSEAWAN